jgi:hypothetical protein
VQNVVSDILLSKKNINCKISGNKISKIFGPMRGEVTRQFGVLQNEELCDLYRSAIIVGDEVVQSV